MNEIKISFKDYAIIRFYLACNGDTPCYYNATCFIFANNIDSKPKAFCRFLSSFKSGDEVQKFHVERYGWFYEILKDELKNSPELNSLGPDPFGSSYTVDNLAKGLKKTSRAIKTALLDQSIVAGLGNIYADEVLFASHILPTKSAKSLTNSEIEAIFNVIKPILQKSIDNRGTTFSDYRDADGHKGNNASQLKVYGRAGQPCLVCGQELRKETIGGRSSVYCPNCQH